MSKQIRTFVAIPITPSKSLRTCMRLLAELGGPLRHNTPDQLHITLKFLGDTTWEQTPEVGAAIDDVLKSHVPIGIQLQGVGAFPRRQRPRVIWAGVETEANLKQIANQLNEHMAELGFPLEERDFHPHLTLAYVKGRLPIGAEEWFETYQETDFGTYQVNDVKLYQSELTPSGPIYTMISHHPLTG